MTPIFLAVLPLLLHSLHFYQAFFLGALVSFALWFTFAFFKVTGPLFPEKVKDLPLICWLATASQLAVLMWGLTPLWSASLYLLLISSKQTPQTLFWKGAGFWMLLTFLGIIQDLLGERFSILLFHLPAGSFLLLAAAAVLCGHFFEVPEK